MKKLIATLFVVFTALTGTVVAGAQEGVRVDFDVRAETDGGLGRGISNMVRSILGETDWQEPVVAPQPALMMNVNTATETTIAPQAQTMSLKSAVSASASESATRATDTDLHAYILELMDEDVRIQSVDTTDTHVRVTYAAPAKVFGAIPVALRVTAAVYASGKTEVTYPWYSFVATGIAPDFKAAYASRVQALVTGEPFTLDEQQILIDETHAALSAAFGSSVRGER